MNIFNSVREGRIFILLFFFFFSFESLPGIYTLSASSIGGYRFASDGNCYVSATLLPETGSTRVIVKPNLTPFPIVTLNPASAAILFKVCCNAAYSKTNTTLKRNTAATVANTDIISIPMLCAYRTDYRKRKWLKIRNDVAAEEIVNRFYSCGENKDACLQPKTKSRVNMLNLLSIPE